ncbi:MAG: DUF58 domain-containing protein, partial [Bacteroidetes bacterium]|nr:DUF58 domain-containing protein [Bacteroidota bacterium]
MKATFKKYISDLFFTGRWYAALIICSILFLLKFFLLWLGVIPFIATGVVAIAAIIDYYFLFSKAKGIFAARSHAERFSNGDE